MTTRGILGNTTELPIVEHATDSHGQILATFALFDLVGLRLSPRIAKLTDKQLWRPQPAAHYQPWPAAGPLLTEHAQVDLIAEHWPGSRGRMPGMLPLRVSLTRGSIETSQQWWTAQTSTGTTRSVLDRRRYAELRFVALIPPSAKNLMAGCGAHVVQTTQDRGLQPANQPVCVDFAE